MTVNSRFLNRWTGQIVMLAVGLFLVACNIPKDGAIETAATVTSEVYGATSDGEEALLFTLTNSNGEEVRITNYGGIVVSLKVLDKNGNLGDVVLGFDSLEDYIKDSPYFGALIGRYGNRIGQAKFALGSDLYELAANDGENHLHGGEVGFDKVLWTPESFVTYNGAVLRLEYVSEDGEEGYPGTLETRVTYTWTDDSALEIEYRANTDKTTVVNLTHHSYFNLKDAGASSILEHELMINADRFTPIDEQLIPDGKIGLVADTALDFLESRPIGESIDDNLDQLKFGKGYDLNYILNRRGDGISLAARVNEPTTGRVLEVFTTEPGVQFYSGNFLDGHHVGKGGVAYENRSAFTLETQHYPDSPNIKAFPSTVLTPGTTYQSKTIYKFSTVKDSGQESKE